MSIVIREPEMMGDIVTRDSGTTWTGFRPLSSRSVPEASRRLVDMQAEPAKRSTE